MTRLISNFISYDFSTYNKIQVNWIFHSSHSEFNSIFKIHSKVVFFFLIIKPVLTA